MDDLEEELELFQALQGSQR